MAKASSSFSAQLRHSEQTRKPVETKLSTDERVLARITDGIYRQPASALRELISNAYDADATEVVILTDAPRFGQISVRDNGLGLSPEVLEHLIKHIGGSAKRTAEGKTLGVTATDTNFSPGGRQLIGKLGIGLFSVAQFTRHFLIITKTKDDAYRTIADITLGPVAGQQNISSTDGSSEIEIQTGHVRSWREPAGDQDSQGTEIKLLDLLPRTRAELASSDLWAKIEYENEDLDGVKTPPPKFHIGRMAPGQAEILGAPPQLPWRGEDLPRERFGKLIQAVRDAVKTESELVDLELLFDRYLQTLWNLALAVPLEYSDIHPFDIVAGKDFVFFELENTAKGQAKRLDLKSGETPRELLKLQTPNGAPGASFEVFVDGVQLLRPILFTDLPKASAALKTPLLFLGHHTQNFDKKPIELSGGPLSFEAYLFWAPKIVPKQHQGVMLRVGNASGTLFDRTFMDYQVSEQTRTRQITAEIFVRQGLDGAINLDRESFNYAHPHFQYLVKWLHSALRQLTNRQKEIGKELRSQSVALHGARVRAEVEQKVELSLATRGVEELPEVVLLESAPQTTEVGQLRNAGAIVFRKNAVLPSPSTGNTRAEQERRKLMQDKAKAITQLLHGWGVLDKLSYDEQEQLIHDILDIVLL